MKDMIAMGVFLFVVAALAGTLLAFTELATAPRIEQNRLNAFTAARQKVLPTAVSFRELQVATGGDTVATISLGFDAHNTFVGTVQNVAPRGYGGAIDIVLGCSPEGLVTGIQVKASHETPGLGTKLQEETFLQKVIGVVQDKKEKTRLFLKKDNGDIDGITAATISSRAFCSGVREGVKRLHDAASAIQQAITTSANNDASDEQPPVGDEQPPASDEQPPVGDEQPPAGDEQPSSSDEQSPAGDVSLDNAQPSLGGAE